MSKAEELLNSSFETVAMSKQNNDIALFANTPDEEHIVIGNDRQITVPVELTRLAVQYDHNIETVTFDCPRYWDDHDMSQMSVYINYLRVDGESGVCQAENVEVDSSDSSIMHFDWTITRNVTEAAGKLVFLVCVKKANSDGNLANHWNSELCKDCYVSEGLENDDEEIKELYTDVIEQWHQIILDTVKMRDSGQLDGATFIPSVNSDSVLSWSNNRGRVNPTPVNIRGLPGISPTIEVVDITGGHRIRISDHTGKYSFDLMDTVINESDAVRDLLHKLIYVGGTEPTDTPTLWFESVVTSDYVYTEYENLAFKDLKDRVTQLEYSGGAGSGGTGGTGGTVHLSYDDKGNVTLSIG